MQIRTPAWVKHAIFYEIIPDRFCRSQKAQQSPLQQSLNLEPWDAIPTDIWGTLEQGVTDGYPASGYKGGDLWGVIERLEYLKTLGITAIYLSPIFQSSNYHRYHTQDYYQVDFLLGGNEALRELLNTAHSYGIKIILDGVFNHVGRGFLFFNEILENGPTSPWLNWFKIRDWPIKAYDDNYPANYVCWWNRREVPELNLENPATREYIMQVAEYWIKFGIDGWRIDAPPFIEVQGFWQEFRNRVKAINPEAYLAGEIWFGAEPWMDGQQFDGLTNYQFTAATLAFVGGDQLNPNYLNNAFKDYRRSFNQDEPERGFFKQFEPLYALKSLNAQEYAEKIQKLLSRYHWELQLTQLNPLASHDTARWMTLSNGDISSIEIATLLLMTFPGAPCLYYGDEVGLQGGLDPDNRRGFPAEDNWNLEVLAIHRQLIALRHQYPAVRLGSYQVLYAQNKLYVFARILDSQEIIVAVNAGRETEQAMVETQAIRLPEGDCYSLQNYPRRMIYASKNISESGVSTWKWKPETKQFSFNLPPRSGLVIGSMNEEDSK